MKPWRKQLFRITTEKETHFLEYPRPGTMMRARRDGVRALAARPRSSIVAGFARPVLRACAILRAMKDLFSLTLGMNGLKVLTSSPTAILAMPTLPKPAA